VPIHPQIASKLHLLEGIASFEAAMADPVQRARLDEFMSITGAPLPPQVATRDETAPGPHDDVVAAFRWVRLEGLCPTVVINAEYDDLRSSGEDFVARLALAGVDVRQVTAVGMLHGFLNTRADVEPVGQALDLRAEVVAGGGLAVAA
jgi:acetyl esterase/lipase